VGPRDRLIAAAIEVIAARGPAGASLSQIAKQAGVSKALVLYHFSGKDELLSAAVETVLGELIEVVGRAVEQAPAPAEAVFAYARSMATHMAERPAHARVLAEMLALEELTGKGARRLQADRWEALAGLIRAADLAPADPVVAALVIGGAIDALVARSLADPAFDLAAAGRELERLLRRALEP
jgi:AcrR family transcriptional regulator